MSITLTPKQSSLFTGMSPGLKAEPTFKPSPFISQHNWRQTHTLNIFITHTKHHLFKSNNPCHSPPLHFTSETLLFWDPLHLSWPADPTEASLLPEVPSLLMHLADALASNPLIWGQPPFVFIQMQPVKLGGDERAVCRPDWEMGGTDLPGNHSAKEAASWSSHA